MSDELYFPFRHIWLRKWVKARYTCTLAELRAHYGDRFEITGPGELRGSAYGDGTGPMYDWSSTRSMAWEKSSATVKSSVDK